MLRNKAITTLQKTYDDSYLSCSTAVYYESQGDEAEATRHWKSALDQIYEYHATKTGPAAYKTQTDTEKALVDALKELELQCKERIDLLEALRASRQVEFISTSGTNNLPVAQTDNDSYRGKGLIGQGTIPAVTYSELSRPLFPNRPILPARTSSESSMARANHVNTDTVPCTKPKSRSRSPDTISIGRQDKTVRSLSAEKHIMRTTLRSAKAGDKSSGATRKSHQLATEGPSKAATLAWSAFGSRERPTRTSPCEGVPAVANSSPRQSTEQLLKTRSPQLQWDSNSRRLVPSRDADSSSNSSKSTNPIRHSDEYPSPRPSYLSVSAASSALNSSSNQQESVSADQAQTRLERRPALRTMPVSGGLSRSHRDEPTNSVDIPTGLSEVSERRSASDPPTRKKAVGRSPACHSQSLKIDQGQESQSRRHEEHKPRKASVSSSPSDDDGIPLKSKPRSSKRKESLFKTDSGGQSSEDATGEDDSSEASWKRKKAGILKSLPSGLDEAAARQILNDVIVKGDEVHWSDIAGLEIAKNALRENVVYPFLRPDLFMGLREPARGMLLFGPPGTGKTMLARAVATESKSTFFSISASSLTSKYLGESEKLVRALFGLARSLAPSIIFVDEIDSLLSQRSGSGEHEATRRIKTEFLIQWSDLQRAAAGRETTERDKERGDANRVLVLAATNLPWAIDEAARRRFVRRQYIPLPEATTRETQLRTLLGQQKHTLSHDDIGKLVELTDGFSGSDITALAKDAAMGPLRSLGEALLYMTMDDIRPITLADFESSLGTIRPSVSKSGLKEYEDWAKEFGERGG